MKCCVEAAEAVVTVTHTRREARYPHNVLTKPHVARNKVINEQNFRTRFSREAKAVIAAEKHQYMRQK